MQILAVDAGFQSMGLCFARFEAATGLLDVTGVKLVETKKASTKSVRRSSDDFRRATELADRLRFSMGMVDVVFAEIPSGTQSARASWALGIALGVLTVVERPLFQVTPTQTQLASIGRYDATKDEIIEWASKKYPTLGWIHGKRKKNGELSPKNEHIADSVAILHAGLQLAEFRQVLGVARNITQR